MKQHFDRLSAIFIDFKKNKNSNLTPEGACQINFYVCYENLTADQVP